MTNGELKRKAKQDMKNNYGYAFLTTVLLNLVLFGSFTVGFLVGGILAAGAVKCCKIAFYTDIAKRDFRGIDSTYRGFRQFLRALCVTLISGLIIGLIVLLFGILMLSVRAVAVLWVLIAIVCIVIINIKIGFSFYVMNDDVERKAFDCIKQSFMMTKGYFWRILLFELSYIGWNILVALTLGILEFYVRPYYNTAKANLYLEMKNHAEFPLQTENTVADESEKRI